MKRSRANIRPVEAALRREEDIPLYRKCACGARAKLVSAWGYWLPGARQFAEYTYKCEVCKNEHKE